jgi:polyisoprenoid-binding protein YceI
LKETTYKANKAGFALTGTLSRAAYGLTWNETFEGTRPIIGDTVSLLLYIEINREQKS